ncbi:MAG: TonB-dependent receptor plug domain-containing protein [Gammaproteobacteria bacterium]|nr:TonB-dependent receptor plug domain-containing protein [Gammaproteobacteria bacterium]
MCNKWLLKMGLWIMSVGYVSSVWAALPVTVLARGSGDPVANAIIATLDGRFHETTNAQGKLLADIELPVTLRVVSPGYSVWQQELSADQKTLTVYLEPTSDARDKLVVKSTRIVDQTSKVALVQEEMTNVAGSHGEPLKAIQSVPGVVAAAEFGGQVYIRGSDTPDNAIRVNGMNLPWIFHWAGDSSTINGTLMQDINLFLGGFPVDYADKIGGAIDVKLRAPKKDRVHQYYNLGFNEGGFLLEGPLGAAHSKNGFYVAARHSYLDLLLTPTAFQKLAGGSEPDAPISFVTIPQYYDMQATVHHEGARGTVAAHFFSAKEAIAITNNRAANNDPQLTGVSNSSAYNAGGVEWRQKYTPEWESVVTTDLNRQTERTRVGTDPATGQPYYVDGTYWQASLRPELRWRGDTDDVSLGVDGKYSTFDLNLYISASPNESNKTTSFTDMKKFHVDKYLRAADAAGYVKHRRRWTPRLLTHAGLRYSAVRATGGVNTDGAVPRVGAEYKINDQFSASFTWGLYRQLPAYNEILVGYSNPHLKYLRGEHRVVGIKYEISPLWNISVEAYQKLMKNLVVAVDNQSPPDNFANAGEGLAYGVDFYLKREAQGRRMGWISYSYGRSTRKNSITEISRPFSGDQPHTLTAVWGEPFGGSWRRWSWSAKFSAHSGLPYTAVVGRVAECVDSATGGVITCAPGAAPDYRWRPIYGDYNGARLPAYYKLDIRINREALYETWRVNYYLDVQNVTNHANVAGYDYGANFQYIDQPRQQRGFPIMPIFGIEAVF